MAKLTPRQARFIAEYLVDANAAQAARRAGYSKSNLEAQGARLMATPSVRAALDEAMARRAARVEVKADDVLRTLLRLLGSDLRQAFGADGCLLPIHDLPDDVAAAIAGVEVDELWEGRGEERRQVGVTRKVKFWDKGRAVELALKHLGLLTDKREVNHTGEVRYRVVQDPFAEDVPVAGRGAEVAGHG